LRAAARGEAKDLTQVQAQALAGQWYGWWVGLHLENPGDHQHWHQTADFFAQAIVEATPYWDDKVRAAAENQQEIDQSQRDREPAVREDVHPMLATEARTAQFLANRGESLSAAGNEVFLDWVMENFFHACALLERRARGDWSPDPRPQAFPAVTLVETPKRSPTKKPVGSCLALFEDYVRSKKPAASTVDRWGGVFKALDLHLGSRDLASFTSDDAQAWSTSLVTSNRGARTVRDIWVSAAHTVCEWARKQKRLKENPFAEVDVTVPNKSRKRGQEFTPEEQALILVAALRITDTRRPFAAACRWAPWLCAYTGARAGEITQLRGRDIKQLAGFVALELTPDAGTIKARKPRTVPLHDHLVEQGFLNYVKAKGDGPLFYNPNEETPEPEDITNPKRPRAVKTRERLAAWIRKLGVTDPEVSPTHAWRHTYKRRAARAKIENASATLCADTSQRPWVTNTRRLHQKIWLTRCAGFPGTRFLRRPHDPGSPFDGAAPAKGMGMGGDDAGAARIENNRPDPDQLRAARFAELCRRPVTDEARALVEHLYTMVLKAEPPRERQRGATKADALRAAIAAFTADLLSAAHRGGWVYRPTNKKAFTGGPVTALTFWPIREALRTLGLVEEIGAWQHRTAFGYGDRRAPRFRATPALVALADEHGVQLAALDQHFPAPLPKAPLVLKARSGALMKIAYTADVRAVEQAVVSLNTFLDRFSIQGGVHRGYIRVFNLGDRPDFAWDLGGRLYSRGDGNYQQLPGAERLKMTIEGEEVCELDIRASYMTILHAQRGQPLDPASDPYDLLPGLGKASRDVVKGFIAMTMGSAAFPRRWSSERASEYLQATGRKLGRDFPLRIVRDAVSAAYPLLAELRSDKEKPPLWASLMFRESEAILPTMLALMERGIPSLSMHDSLIVAQQHETTATELLRSSYEEATAATPFIRCRLP
jgi:integrase